MSCRWKENLCIHVFKGMISTVNINLSALRWRSTWSALLRKASSLGASSPYVWELSCHTMEKLKSRPWRWSPQVFTSTRHASYNSGADEHLWSKHKFCCRSKQDRHCNHFGMPLEFQTQTNVSSETPAHESNIQICKKWSNHNNRTNRWVNGN